MTEEGIQSFYEEMQESEWMLYQKPVEKRGITRALRAWTKYHPEYTLNLDMEGGLIGKEPRESEKQRASVNQTQKIEAEIMKTASNYITKRRFDENPGGTWIQIGKYCPKNAFTSKQLEYMADRWSVWPRTEGYILKDEYWEIEE